MHARPDSLALLGAASVQQLRKRWHEIFKSKPPQAFGPDLLRRAIAQELQTVSQGGLDRAAAASLRRQVRQLERCGGKAPSPPALQPGTVLVREWKGALHQVTIRPGAFEYQSQKYKTLSEIARHITGTRWNGPRFFGLRSKKTNGAT
jgi:hypothetical protein